MQLIIISPDKTKHQHWHFTPLGLYSLGAIALILLSSLAYTIYHFTAKPAPAVTTPPPLASTISQQQVENELATLHSQYAKQLGSLQAEAIRLKALADKLADMSGLDLDLEGLSDVPGVGGVPEQGVAINADEFESLIEQLHSNFEQQQTGLEQIQDYLIQDHNVKSAIPSGKPVKKGWVSSYYGYRIDPFNGKKVFHNGLDIAGKSGSEVVAVADGIVIWQGSRGGYGEMIEIDHGNGYQTRYAHNKKLVVKLGDRIKKGQAIALMGSTGRSTGPHVHFEVLRDGKTINPANFIKE